MVEKQWPLDSAGSFAGSRDLFQTQSPLSKTGPASTLDVKTKEEFPTIRII